MPTWVRKTETLGISYQKNPKVNIVFSYSKDGDLYGNFKVAAVGSDNWEIFKIRKLIAE